MFWDSVSGIYDLFVYIYNRKVHKSLCREINELISSSDDVIECACGTGMLTEGIAQRCNRLIATDFSSKMLKKAEKKCKTYSNVSFEKADILHLSYPDQSFDKVIAANVIHLLDEPLGALEELNRVCRKGGTLIIPTYMNKQANKKTSAFVVTIGKAGADFKRQFDFDTYKKFFSDAGYSNVKFSLIEGKVSCAVAIITKQ